MTVRVENEENIYFFEGVSKVKVFKEIGTIMEKIVIVIKE